MQTANIATAKNHFSQLIEKVKKGQSVLITDRKRPVAVLEPYEDTSTILQSLEIAGVLTSPRSKLDLKSFLSMPIPTLHEKKSLNRAVLDEREESR